MWAMGLEYRLVNIFWVISRSTWLMWTLGLEYTSRNFFWAVQELVGSAVFILHIIKHVFLSMIVFQKVHRESLVLRTGGWTFTLSMSNLCII